jgi:hypothetical protein
MDERELRGPDEDAHLRAREKKIEADSIESASIFTTGVLEERF